MWKTFRTHLQIFWLLSIVIWNTKLQMRIAFYFKDNKLCGSSDNPLLVDMNNVENPGN